jgi:hypothetical protein
VGVLLGVFVGVVVDVGVGVMVDSGVISTSKITFVGVCVDIGDATAVWVEVKNGVISPSEAQPVKMMLEMINKDVIPILINPNFTHLVII